MNYRQNGKNALKIIGLTKPQNIDILEKNIYNYNNNEEIYNKILYQVLNDYKNNIKLSDILNNLKTLKYGWEHETYKKLREEEEQQDEFIINPFQEVEDGIVECKCGSKRVYSFSKQTRGGDEGITSYHQCLKCKSKWSLNT